MFDFIERHCETVLRHVPFCLLSVLKLEIKILISQRISIIIGNIPHSLIHLLSYMCRPELKLITQTGARILKIWSCAEILSKIQQQCLAKQAIQTQHCIQYAIDDLVYGHKSTRLFFSQRQSATCYRVADFLKLQSAHLNFFLVNASTINVSSTFPRDLSQKMLTYGRYSLTFVRHLGCFVGSRLIPPQHPDRI